LKICIFDMSEIFTCQDKARRIENETNKRARKRKQKSKDRNARKQQRRESLRKVLLEAVYGGDDFFTISSEYVSHEMEDDMRNKIQRLGAVYLRCKHTFLNQVLKTTLKDAPLPIASILNSLIAINSGQVALVISPKGTDILVAIQAILDTEGYYRFPKAGQVQPEGESFIIKAGPTGLDPSGYGFSAWDIPTKINRGQIEIVSDVRLISPGQVWHRSLIWVTHVLGGKDIIPIYPKVCHVLTCGKLFTYDEFRLEIDQIRYGVQQTMFDSAALAYTLFQDMETAFPGLRAEIDFNLMIQDINNFEVGTGLFEFLSLQVRYWKENKGNVFKIEKETMI